MYDVIIVGSGPSGIAAALQLKEKNIVIVDVGLRPPTQTAPVDNCFLELRKNQEDVSPFFLGKNLEGLQNIFGPEMSPKIKSPYMRFVTKNTSEFLPRQQHNFDSTVSFSKGGLANAWGAGVYRYNDRELEAFPISEADLTPYYDQLTQHIGISGADDDLTGYFGSTENLMSPLNIDPLSESILNRYQKNKNQLNSQGIFIGRPRLAVLSEEHNGREKYDYHGLESFQPNIPSVYNPTYTLNELIAKKQVTYIDQQLVLSFKESDDSVCVFSKNLKTGASEKMHAKKLILASGTLSTAKIILTAKNDHQTKLPILDNAISFIPFYDPMWTGAAEKSVFYTGAQLNIVLDSPQLKESMQGSVYGITGILKSDCILNLPLAMKSNLVAAKMIAGAMSVFQMFYPGRASDRNFIQLSDDKQLKISYDESTATGVEDFVINSFRKLGLWSSRHLCQFPKPGCSIHYAGTMPMRRSPAGEYETDAYGKLNHHRNTYIVDGSVLSSLASKNHTFTIMANAMRISEKIRKGLE